MTVLTPSSLDPASEHLLRELAPQVLGAVIRRFHDFASAEDAVQEALIAAVMQWPLEGVPENPRGWLIQVACRRMTDYCEATRPASAGKPQWLWNPNWSLPPSMVTLT